MYLWGRKRDINSSFLKRNITPVKPRHWALKTANEEAKKSSLSASLLSIHRYSFIEKLNPRKLNIVPMIDSWHTTVAQYNNAAQMLSIKSIRDPLHLPLSTFSLESSSFVSSNFYANEE